MDIIAGILFILFMFALPYIGLMFIIAPMGTLVDSETATGKFFGMITFLLLVGAVILSIYLAFIATKTVFFS